MKITKFLTSACLSSALILGSCSEDATSGIDLPKGEVKAGTVSVRLKNSSIDSKSVTEGEKEAGVGRENEINNVEFFVFDSNGNRDALTTDADYKGYYNFSSVTGSDFAFAVSEGTDKIILVAVNMNLTSLGEQGLAAVKQKMHNVAVTPLVIPTEGIPMAGDVTGVTVEEGDVKSVTIEVSRLYAKFNAPTVSNTSEVIVKQENTEAEYEKLLIELFGDEFPVVGELQFKLQNFIVVNGLKKSYAFENYGDISSPVNDRWDPSAWRIGAEIGNYTASEYTAEKELISAYSGDTFLGLSSNVYLYENSPVRFTNEGGVKGSDPATVYALIIKGELSDEGQNKATRYWRINVNKSGSNDNIYQIVRNAIYNVKIGNIKTIGYGTPGEAEEEKPIIVDPDQAAIEAFITVADWMVFNENADI